MIDSDRSEAKTRCLQKLKELRRKGISESEIFAEFESWIIEQTIQHTEDKRRKNK